MRHYFDFHEKDIQISSDMDNEIYCSKLNKVKPADWIPFLSFPITKHCNFRCIYCGFGGEATGSEQDVTDLDFIKSIVPVAIARGVRKFRVTGGEPLLHSDIGNILKYFSELGYFTLVNSNGSLVTKKRHVLTELLPNIRFAVSLDTLRPNRLQQISGRDCLSDVLEGIHFLKSKNLLLRLNMVVGQHNYDEIYDIITFCNELSCDLKILDIVSVPVPFGQRQDYYKEVSSLEKEFKQRCDGIFSHEYTRGFGTPCFKYKFGNTYVTVKNSAKGSHYDVDGICSSCPYFPCHEGLYDIFALSDGGLCSCRWSERQFSEDQGEQLDFLINSFRKSRFIPVNSTIGMTPRTDLTERIIRQNG
jgi:MoaA/NifB/PqqE/SkfB family radical SAM enzyme